MDLIFNYFKDNLIGGSGTVLTYMSKASIDLFSNSIVTNILSLFDWIGYVLFAVGVVFSIANVYIEYLETGSFTAHLWIINVLKAIIAIAFLKVGAIQLYDISNTLNTYVSQIASAPNYNTQLSNLNNTLGTTQNLNVMWVCLIGIFALGGIIVCLLQIMKRGGMYMTQIILGYLYVFSIPSGNTDGFFEWCKTTAAIALTNVVQTALLYIGLSLMANDLTKMFLGIGIIMSASSVEKVAGRFGLTPKASNRPGMPPLRNMGSSANFASNAGDASSFADAGASATSMVA